MSKMLAVGDCNTLGAGDLIRNTWVERFGRAVGVETVNIGHTMATTREGIHLMRDHRRPDIDITAIQFGLVDCWLTFKYAPYVLYYPNNVLRKLMRKVVKSYKKICRSMKLTEKLGTKHVVSPKEYEANVIRMIELAREGGMTKIYLVESAPHMEDQRNGFLREYNAILARVAATQPGCNLIECFDALYREPERCLTDGAHLSEKGNDIIAKRLIEVHAASAAIP